MRRAMLAIAVAALLPACGASLISNQQEVEIGQSVDVEIEKEYRIAAADDPVARWADELVRPLAASSKPFRDPADIGGYKVEVIADDTLVNAFAAPGGYTYISTGLILQASDCAEIAGVMGHELAHVTQRHSVDQMEKSFAAQQLADLFLNDGLAKDAGLVVWSFLQATKFSQEHEEEADSVGLRISHDAGYNPFGLVEFFKKILALEKGGGGTPQFLSSHPATNDRIKDVTGQIKSRYGDAVRPGETQSYQCVGTRLQLADVQKRIRDGQIKVRAGTGGGAK